MGAAERLPFSCPVITCRAAQKEKQIPRFPLQHAKTAPGDPGCAQSDKVYWIVREQKNLSDMAC
jgi:hypothetical protein